MLRIIASGCIDFSKGTSNLVISNKWIGGCFFSVLYDFNIGKQILRRKPKIRKSD